MKVSLLGALVGGERSGGRGPRNLGIVGFICFINYSQGFWKVLDARNLFLFVFLLFYKAQKAKYWSSLVYIRFTMFLVPMHWFYLVLVRFSKTLGF